jgi:hypothetical protein
MAGPFPSANQSKQIPSLRKKAFLITSRSSTVTAGKKNLESLEYADEIHAQMHFAALNEFGEVITLKDPKMELDEAAAQARRRGLDPIHLSFVPLQHTLVCRTAPNVVVAAWEYPDIPEHDFENTAQKNWWTAANSCDMIFVNGDFTATTLRQGNIASNIKTVSTPVSQEYFQLNSWIPDLKSRVSCRAYWPTNIDHKRTIRYASRTAAMRDSCHFLNESMRAFGKWTLGPSGYRQVKQTISDWSREYRRKKSASSNVMRLDFPHTSELSLSGIVYTCIVDPEDDRKNWRDALNAYLLSLADCEDATLVFNVSTRSREAAKRVIKFYQDREFDHKSKVAFVIGSLSPDTMLQLTQATTYFLQCTKAERVCAPMVNFLAAGRPAISPCHSAIQDYFNSDMGWVVDSSEEPAHWPHDSRDRIRTTCARINWPSCVESLRASYDLAKQNYHQYVRLAEACRTSTYSRCSHQAVTESLRSALLELEQRQQHGHLEHRPMLLKFDQRQNLRKTHAA